MMSDLFPTESMDDNRYDGQEGYPLPVTDTGEKGNVCLLDEKAIKMEYVIEIVAKEFACPKCGENDMDLLIWDDDEHIKCTTCGESYDLPRNVNKD